MRLKWIYFILICIGLWQNALAQFKILDQKRAEKISFELYNNLIILEAKVNKQSKFFLLDSGVEKTVLFVNQLQHTIDTNAVKKINIRSLGSKNEIKAYKQEAHIQFKSFINHKAEVYAITHQEWQLSNKLGVDVDGIIGYDFFKNHIVKIDYLRKFIKIYNPSKFNRKLSSYYQTPIKLNGGKPYLQASVETTLNYHKNLELLVDLGASDAIWLVENQTISKPKLRFFDILGYGLNQPIYGYRSKAKKAILFGVKLNNPRYAFVESGQVWKDKTRNGLVGGEMLRRFKHFFDYTNNKIYSKPNSFFKDNFNYDKSGLILKYAGKVIRKFEKTLATSLTKDNKSHYSDTSTLKKQTQNYISEEDIVIIHNIRPNSPASAVNIKKGDRLLSINGKSVSKLGPLNINQLLSQDKEPTVKLKLQRGQTKFRVNLKLQSIFNSLN